MQNSFHKSTTLSALALAGITILSLAQPAWAQTFPGIPSPGATGGVHGNSVGVAALCDHTGMDGFWLSGNTMSCKDGIGSGVSLGLPGQTWSYTNSCQFPTDLSSCNAIVSQEINNEQSNGAWLTSHGYLGVVSWTQDTVLTFCQICFGTGTGTGGTCGDINLFDQQTQRCDGPGTPLYQRIYNSCGQTAAERAYGLCCGTHPGGCPTNG